jgi:putative acetyltransferase
LLKIFSAKSKLRIDQARELLLEYAASLGFDLGFQNFEKELNEFPGEYAPPDGCLLLAIDSGRLVGCVALKKISPDQCEMKRLYVRPEFRGRGIGRKLSEAIIREARKIGYARMSLDTVPSMKAAAALYRSLRFKEIPPYRYNPIKGTLFMELDLTSARSSAS